eukprot:CAMPEP_0119014654 /NCGR_PEP_ID=MMETSP1176-20130426/10111_1 /TAXON_ID=265551 /ORGANISM="Synedropsis recta cf, Strain CCMP1620" /LENGTH=400 /DNA_ID=CAMNT_0006967861 /DNA_START=34 /DNA_END=1236 /DNA_ORIENTATION=-
MKGEALLNMASTITNVETRNGSQDTSQVVAQDLDQHISTSHTGLSALLNAVTIHISKSDEEQNDETQRYHMKADETDYSDCQPKQEPTSTTPVMVPELHESQKDTFPGRLMTLLLDPDNDDIVTFLPDGKYFALRKNEFACKIMKEKLKIDDYGSFAGKLSEWGFCPVETKRPGIKVYRHKLFRKGDWKRCEEMKQGDSGTENKEIGSLVIPTSRTSSISEDDCPMDRSNESAKRRLSPTSAAKTNNSSFSKLRMHSSDEESSAASTDTRSRTEGRRMLALSITTDKLNIREKDNRQLPLVQQAVTGATHTIVTDAIEALLRDEEHSRKTFQKHADELSKSSLPGLIPISKQLFSVGEEKSAANGNNGADRKKEERRGSAEKPTRLEGDMLLSLAKKWKA